jgi:hypothetical protein
VFVGLLGVKGLWWRWKFVPRPDVGIDDCPRDQNDRPAEQDPEEDAFGRDDGRESSKKPASNNLADQHADEKSETRGTSWRCPSLRPAGGWLDAGNGLPHAWLTGWAQEGLPCEAAWPRPSAAYLRMIGDRDG